MSLSCLGMINGIPAVGKAQSRCQADLAVTVCEGEPQSHSKGPKFPLSLGGAPIPTSLFLNKWIMEVLPARS